METLNGNTRNVIWWLVIACVAVIWIDIWINPEKLDKLTRQTKHERIQNAKN